MPAIRPVSDLRNNYPEIEKMLQEQPVFLTKNGVGTSVIMSMQEYENTQKLMDLYLKLAEVENDVANGDVGKDIDNVFANIRGNINEKYKNI